ncbi:MAG: hypothetical protein HC847_10560 [Hydrococcus sp. RU_2_2]|nr:hypothetical protein [Hydrococcus sp. RU_2_2]NJP19453.1 hypothetical protein [Hydrococcus sp. CRU_1_1]
MIFVKFLVFAAIAIVIVKLVASLFGKGNIPLLNNLITVILGIFVAFEVIKLGQILWEKFI